MQSSLISIVVIGFELGLG